MKRPEIERLLPQVFQRTLRPGNPLVAFLEIMEVLHEPSEDILQQLDAVFDPRRTRDEFVPFLARWVDLQPLFQKRADEQQPGSPAPLPFTPGLGRLRELVATATYLSRWRGTSKGLILFLETATGIRGFQIQEQVLGEDGLPRPFHIKIPAPRAAQPHRLLIERIIELEKPAYVTHEIEFTDVNSGGG